MCALKISFAVQIEIELIAGRRHFGRVEYGAIDEFDVWLYTCDEHGRQSAQAARLTVLFGT